MSGLGQFGLQITLHDQLVAHVGVFQQLTAGVAAVETHKGLGQPHVVLAPDALFVHGGGHGVVDVQQGGGGTRHANADVLAQSAVDIHLTGHRNAPGSQAAVDIAGTNLNSVWKAGQHLLAKATYCRVPLVGLGPVLQSQLVLGQTGQDTGIGVIGAQFGGHFRHLGRNAFIPGVLVVGHQQVQLAVLLHGNTQIIQRLDGGVAGQEIVGTGTEGDDLQPLQAQNGPGNG